MTEHKTLTIDCDDQIPGFAAAYLRTAGSECAFIETYTSHAVSKCLNAVKQAGKRPEDVRWIVVTHAHLDHAGGAGALLKACPNATLLAHPRAHRHLVDPSKLIQSASAVYGADRFRELYGTIEPIPADRARALDDNATFSLGNASFQVLHTQGHAKHHFVVHDQTLSAVFTGDTFGLVYPLLQKRGRFALASTSPTDFDASEARKSIDRVLSLGARTAYPTHFGELNDLDVVANQLRKWIDFADGWVTDAAKRQETTEEATTRLRALWRNAITDDANARGLGFGTEEFRFLELDIDLNAQGLAFAADRKKQKRE